MKDKILPRYNDVASRMQNTVEVDDETQSYPYRFYVILSNTSHHNVCTTYKATG